MKRPGKVFGALLALLPPTIPAPATAVEPTFRGIVGADAALDILPFSAQSLEIKKVVICSRDR